MAAPYNRRNASQSFIRVNNRIRVPEVRCVAADGAQIGVLPTREALSMALDQGLDLVEISPTARPPVCRIMDFGKYKYESGKKEKAQRRHQSQTRVKEVQFHLNVGDHDYETKLRHIREFLEEGHRVKVSLYYRGRENAHREMGYDLMNRVIADLKEFGAPEQMPKLMGRSLIMLMTPKPGLRQKVAKTVEGEPSS